jgi:predicted TIM-barrel fold metal-dependent hydrolase
VDKIWVNSADSHVLEPERLWLDSLPSDLAERAPRSVRDDTSETVYVDGIALRRDPIAFQEAMRPPGARDLVQRMRDLDAQGVWGEIVFPSAGLWTSNMTDPKLAKACCAAWNDWAADTIIAASPRLVPAAILPILDTDDAVEELHRAVGLGFRTAYLPATLPEDRGWSSDVWEPLWSVLEETGIPAAVHIGTGAEQKLYRGPGGAIVNYVETSYAGQRAVVHLTASGGLDRHPGLNVLIAEGGAAWVPALADRMDEAYRQHDMFVRPKLSRSPTEQLFSQVWVSFQHDHSALPIVESTGYHNVLWGSDYPHLEGTFPRTQEVLHGLFDGVSAETRRLVTVDNFTTLLGLPELVPLAA